jgi:hypothetical protein
MLLDHGIEDIDAKDKVRAWLSRGRVCAAACVRACVPACVRASAVIA